MKSIQEAMQWFREQNEFTEYEKLRLSWQGDREHYPYTFVYDTFDRWFAYAFPNDVVFCQAINESEMTQKMSAFKKRYLLFKNS